MVANFNDCKIVMEILIDERIGNFDSDPETAIMFLENAFKVFNECADLTISESKELYDSFIDAFITRFGYDAYGHYFGFEDDWDSVFDDPESESSDSREIIKTEFGYQFI